MKNTKTDNNSWAKTRFRFETRFVAWGKRIEKKCRNFFQTLLFHESLPLLATSIFFIWKAFLFLQVTLKINEKVEKVCLTFFVSSCDHESKFLEIKISFFFVVLNLFSCVFVYSRGGIKERKISISLHD